jgi:transcription elongation factor GreA
MPPSYLTRQGYHKLQEELEQLRTVKRQEVANRLHEAMEGGELIEDAEYEAAKNEQAFVEGRIQELKCCWPMPASSKRPVNDVVQIALK